MRETVVSTVCPRCEGYIPNNDNPGAYPGAVSRVDNTTEICSACGVEEAIVALVSIEFWPVTQWDNLKFNQASERKGERLELRERYS